MSVRDPLVAIALAFGFGLGCGGEGDEVDAGADADPSAPDATPADAPSLAPCDPLAQVGCAPDEKCSIVPSDVFGEPAAIGCVPAGGSTAAFQPCTPATYLAPDDCLRGLVCVGAVAPRCLPVCTDYPADTCGAGQVCALGEDLDGDWVVDVSYCAETCELFDQNGCFDPTFACYPTGQGPICLLEGAGDTPALEGEPCEYANSCAEGLACFRIGVLPEWYCFALCDPFGGAGPTCALDQSCYLVGDEPWGVCQDDF